MSNELLELRNPRGDGSMALYVFHEFFAKLADRVLHRPGCTNGQAADGGSGHDSEITGHLKHEVQVLDAPAAGLHALHGLVKPARAFPAGSALAAALVREEPARVVQVVDNAGRVVDHGDCR